MAKGWLQGGRDLALSVVAHGALLLAFTSPVFRCQPPPDDAAKAGEPARPPAIEQAAEPAPAPEPDSLARALATLEAQRPSPASPPTEEEAEPIDDGQGFEPIKVAPTGPGFDDHDGRAGEDLSGLPKPRSVEGAAPGPAVTLPILAPDQVQNRRESADESLRRQEELRRLQQPLLQTERELAVASSPGSQSVSLRGGRALMPAVFSFQRPAAPPEAEVQERQPAEDPGQPKGAEAPAEAQPRPEVAPEEPKRDEAKEAAARAKAEQKAAEEAAKRQAAREARQRAEERARRDADRREAAERERAAARAASPAPDGPSEAAPALAAAAPSQAAPRAVPPGDESGSPRAESADEAKAEEQRPPAEAEEAEAEPPALAASAPVDPPPAPQPVPEEKDAAQAERGKVSDSAQASGDAVEHRPEQPTAQDLAPAPSLAQVVRTPDVAGTKDGEGTVLKIPDDSARSSAESFAQPDLGIPMPLVQGGEMGALLADRTALALATVDPDLARPAQAPSDDASERPQAGAVVVAPEGQGTGSRVGGAAIAGTGEIRHLVQERINEVTRMLAPSAIRRAHTTGLAILEFSVDPRGYVRDLQVVLSTGSDVLDEEADRIVRLGEPYPGWSGLMKVVVTFEIGR